jgi:hypothetical protein
MPARATRLSVNALRVRRLPTKYGWSPCAFYCARHRRCNPDSRVSGRRDSGGERSCSGNERLQLSLRRDNWMPAVLAVRRISPFDPRVPSAVLVLALHFYVLPDPGHVPSLRFADPLASVEIMEMRHLLSRYARAATWRFRVLELDDRLRSGQVASAVRERPGRTGPLTSACAPGPYQFTARSWHVMLKPKERIGADRSAQATRQFPLVREDACGDRCDERDVAPVA